MQDEQRIQDYLSLLQYVASSQHQRYTKLRSAPTRLAVKSQPLNLEMPRDLSVHTCSSWFPWEELVSPRKESLAEQRQEMWRAEVLQFVGKKKQ